MIIYLVTVNGKISQEAYKTLEEAQDFIKRRLSVYPNPKAIEEINRQVGGYYIVTSDDGSKRYQINAVRIKEH